MKEIIAWTMGSIGFVLIVMTYQIVIDLHGRVKMIGERLYPQFPVGDE